MKYNYVILLDYSVGKIIKIRLSQKQKRESKKYYDFESWLHLGKSMSSGCWMFTGWPWKN